MGLVSKPANRNSYWADLIVEELVRLECTVFFISPGSRSSPLVTAVAKHSEAQAIVHYDERGGAFAALGYARTSGKPGVWITTSGTAVANGLPAVIEASTDAVPLLLITADRPPELRETGSNQTIRQPEIFANHVRWSFDMPTPSSEIDPAFVLTTIDQLVYRASAEKGPVHLNCMFREPLAPDEEPYVSAESGTRFERWKSSAEPYTRYAMSEKRPSDVDMEKIRSMLESAKRPICVLGRLSDSAFAAKVMRWATENGIPIFPDVTSGLRLGSEGSAIIPYYDLLLAGGTFRAQMKPDAVVQLGRAPVSKRLLMFLSEASPDPYIIIADGPERIDPFHGASFRLNLDRMGTNAAFMAEDFQIDVADNWLDNWKNASDRIERWLTDFFGDTSGALLSEQAVARRLSEIIPDQHVLVLASSLPIRHVDTFASDTGGRVQVVANRGASGIDGTLATAAGSQLGSLKKTTVLIGDLALLHDLNSLSLAAKQKLVVVALNNDGGGIFSYLPIAHHPDVFETFFGTPHGLGFEHAAAMFALTYVRTESVEQFADAYTRALQAEDAVLIEVPTNRASTHALNERLIADIERPLSAT